MADLTLRINSDWSEASRAFKDLASESEATREKIEKFSQSFQSDRLDKFIDRQKLFEASLMGTRGEVAAMTAAQKNYGKEIEKLIRSGLDPESEAIVRLRNEQEALADRIQAVTEKQKLQADGMVAVERAAVAVYAAIGAGVVALGAAVQKSAEAGDSFSKTSRIIGITAEKFQELDYAAKMSGVDDLKTSLENLNRSMGGLKGGSGALNNYLKENDKQLLEQLRTVNSNEQAFNLLMDAIGKAPNEFTQAALAQAAFGKSGQDLILLANEGADGISNLREEARKYGIISNDAAASSEAYLDAQDRLKTALMGVGNELAENLLPGLTDSINGVADFIAGIDDWEGKLDIAKVALIGAAGALTTFVTVSKGAEVVQKMSVAIKALQTAMMGPAGAAALAVGALATAVAAFSVYQDKQKNQGKEIASALTAQKDKALDLLSAYERLNPAKAVDTETTQKLIGLYPELDGKIQDNVTSVSELKEKIEELNNQKTINAAQPLIEDAQEAYQVFLNFQKDYNDKHERLNAEFNRSDIDSVRVAENWMNRKKTAYEEYAAKVNDVLGTIGKQIKIEDGIAKIVESDTKKLETELARQQEMIEQNNKTLSQKLNEMPKSQAQVLGEQINQVKAFLTQRADLENAAGEERIKAFQAELEKIKSNDKLAPDEKVAAEKAAAEAILEVRRKLADDLKKQQEKQNADALAIQKEAAEEQKSHIQTVLDSLGQTEAQSNVNMQSQFTQFLSERLEAEKQNDEARISLSGLYGEELKEAEIAAGEQRLESLKTERENILAQFEEGSAEYLAAQQASDLLILEEDKKLKDARIALKEAEIDAMGDLFSALADLAAAAGKESRTGAILAKGMASAQAAINSYLAFTRALAEHTFPMSAVYAATVLASGLAQQIKILSTPIPSAETGGRFIVPNSVGSDSQLMRVNSGEEVDITPRGMTGSGAAQNIIVQIERQTIFDVVNDGIESGDILIAASNY